MFPGSLCDVAGLRVGQARLSERASGCTVVLCEAGAVCGVDVRGAAPGTRETDLLRPDNLVPQVHAVVLSGGSAFGLDTASGVMRWLEERGHGFAVGGVRVPIVPAAVLFDLWVGDGRLRPGADTGYAACEAATQQAPEQGNAGAGAGATVGKVFGIAHAMKGGIGTASLRVGAVTVGAIVAVNAAGDVIDPRNGSVVAGARSADGRTLLHTSRALAAGHTAGPAQAGAATSIGVIATDAVLSKAQAGKLATMAHDGLARSIDPAHTMTDGDTLFALATGASGQGADMTLLGSLAATVTAYAVLNAVRAARTLPGTPWLAAHDLVAPA